MQYIFITLGLLHGLQGDYQTATRLLMLAYMVSKASKAWHRWWDKEQLERARRQWENECGK